MKVYFCAILLLMYGLAHFATQVQGKCSYGGYVYDRGFTTNTDGATCFMVHCDENDRVGITRCPEMQNCRVGFPLRIIKDFNKPFPHCCEKPVCADTIPAGLGLAALY
ncbi:uncharacterized protein LOC105840242 [Monomorium pharaonis]|uniref:uncharacterized protein LOC105840242 n=1 Tax=Monomorium pharaonis TaxID=307658 RepID=UPI00063EE3F1|nr:uncharacterized protein LOC105840242 [Monomorium pharaonis]